MNIDRLKQAEASFMFRYPGGFDNPELEGLSRKHKMDKMVAFAQEKFAKEQFLHPEWIIEDWIKIVSRASMISVFEKPKFRDYMSAQSPQSRRMLAHGLETLLHGEEQNGFEIILDTLKEGKLAKWPLMTICQTYFHPQVDVFIKPTTTKWVIDYFELRHLTYHPTPTWDLYQAYRSTIQEMKTKVDPSLSPSNAAFTGFLMMSMEFRHS